jgi:hypothetical protein
MSKQKPFVRNSSIPLAETQFEPDATAVKKVVAKTPMYTNTEGGARFNSQDKVKYSSFKKTLPSNLANTSDTDYAMDYYWEKSGKPKDFKSAQSMGQPMFYKEKDGYHAPSVEPTTGRFLKPKHHSTLYKELDWFKGKSPDSKTPDAVKFRQSHTLDSSGKFYKYVAKKKK